MARPWPPTAAAAVPALAVMVATGPMAELAVVACLVTAVMAATAVAAAVVLPEQAVQEPTAAAAVVVCSFLAATQEMLAALGAPVLRVDPRERSALLQLLLVTVVMANLLYLAVRVVADWVVLIFPQGLAATVAMAATVELAVEVAAVGPQGLTRVLICPAVRGAMADCLVVAAVAAVAMALVQEIPRAVMVATLAAAVVVDPLDLAREMVATGVLGVAVVVAARVRRLVEKVVLVLGMVPLKTMAAMVATATAVQSSCGKVAHSGSSTLKLPMVPQVGGPVVRITWDLERTAPTVRRLGLACMFTPA